MMTLFPCVPRVQPIAALARAMSVESHQFRAITAARAVVPDERGGETAIVPHIVHSGRGGSQDMSLNRV